MPMVWKLKSNTACHGFVFSKWSSRVCLKTVKFCFPFFALGFWKAVWFSFQFVFSKVCLFSLMSWEKLRGFYAKSSTVRSENQQGRNNYFFKQELSQRLMDKIFPNLKVFVSLKDNSYLSIAVKKIQMPTENLQLLNILSRPKIMAKKIF